MKSVKRVTRVKSVTILLMAMMALGEVMAQGTDEVALPPLDEQSAAYEVVTTSKRNDREVVVYPNEISLSVGTLSAPQMTNALLTLISLGQVMPMYYAPICLNLGYTHSLTQTVGVGATFSYEHATHESSSDPVTTNSMDYFSLMPTVKLYWFNYEKVAMYSQFGLGVTYRHGNDDNVVKGVKRIWPAYQLSAVCVEAGRNGLRFFLETGVGSTTGLISAGLKIRF